MDPINDWISLAAGGVLDEEDEASVEDSRSGSLGQQCLAALQVALPWLLRGHLAFFYLYGWYYQWSHRLSGSLLQDPFLPNNMAEVAPFHRIVYFWPSLPFSDALHALVQSKFSRSFGKLEPTICRALLLGGMLVMTWSLHVLFGQGAQGPMLT